MVGQNNIYQILSPKIKLNNEKALKQGLKLTKKSHGNIQWLNY